MSDMPNNFMMIGLHKLAAERGDGLIPELLALYVAREKLLESAPLVFDIPAGAVDDSSVKPARNDNVIPLQPYLRARKAR